MSLALSSPATVAPLPREADALAAANWRANIAAMEIVQPALAVRVEAAPTPAVSWVFGRDGALTALDATGHWWAGCSVPAAAARAMLKSLGGTTTVACFLRPPTAAALRIALDRLAANQAIVAIIPELEVARVMLHCENFAAHIGNHRLWLAAGDDWEAQLDSLFVENEGLPIPSQFVRLTDGTEDLAEAMIAPAQRIFSETTHRRAAAIGQLLETTSSPTGQTAARLCVVAPTHFRLWDDAGSTLAELAQKLGASHVDPDDPAAASPLCMARAAAGCDVILTPNTARADLPNVVAPSTPWVTWLTAPRVPNFTAAAPHDVLVVADPAWRHAATAAGWPTSSVHVATWPESRPAVAAAGAPLLICADVSSLDAPKEIIEMSSHRLLWEAIAEELVRDPFVLGLSVLDYLHARMKRLGIARDSLDPRRFIDSVIVPAYARGLAELVKRAGLPLRLAGGGWEQVETLKPLATGAVVTREAFERVIAGCGAVVHVWPIACDHPIDHVGRPVIRATGGRDAFLRDARSAATGTPRPDTAGTAPRLTAQLLGRIMRS